MKERVDLLLKELSKKAGKPTGEVKSATDAQGLFFPQVKINNNKAN